MMSETITGPVEIFTKSNLPWHFVRIPQAVSQPYEIYADRGLIAITATVGESQWPTSLLPYGDRTHFIALPARIRKKERLAVGSSVTVTFELRTRT